MSGPTKESALMADMLEFLDEAEIYFDRLADVVDGSYGQPEANIEMSMLTQVRSLLSRMGDA